MTDTYPGGMAAVILLTFGLLTAVSLLEIWCEFKRWPSISYRVEQWSLRNPWFSGALILFLGMFLAHFLLNPLPGPVSVP